jgi:hypothetical protein
MQYGGKDGSVTENRDWLIGEDNMAETKYLPPSSAVQMVWAITGLFSKDKSSKNYAISTEATLKDIIGQAQRDPDEKQRCYVNRATVAMRASLRSLATIYKGRELNFEENEKLRVAYLDAVKENIEFGSKAKDIIKSLPSITIGTAGGLTLNEFVLNYSDNYFFIIFFALLGAFGGYLFYFAVVLLSREKKLKLYVKQDYERDLYFDLYLNQVNKQLLSLYDNSNKIHEKVFGKIYQEGNDEPKKVIERILDGMKVKHCGYMHKHMKGNKIKPDLWTLCEVGNNNASEERCKYYIK